MSITVSSTAFAADARIPKKFTGEGEDLSPSLAWAGVPKEAQALALICDDPDAPRPEPWVHWVIYNLPGNLSGLPEGVPQQLQLKEPAGAAQGKNSWPDGQNTGYRGPMPPPRHGTHHYHFTLYALKSPLALEPGLTKDQLLKQIEGQVLATGRLTGTYSR